MLLWAKGLAVGLGLDVSVDEPDVSPLAVQGPKADDLMETVFGSTVREIGFFKFRKLDFLGEPLIVARSGYSKQGGFEIYLDDGSKGETLWDTLWRSGQQFNVSPGCPNLIERIEGGLISYGNEMTRNNNPLECGLEKYCQLDGSIDYIGREALEQAHQRGPERMIRGVIFEGDPCPPCRRPWPVVVGNKKAGQITSAIWSPRFKANVALGMIEKQYWNADQKVEVRSDSGTTWQGSVCYLPMQ